MRERAVVAAFNELTMRQFDCEGQSEVAHTTLQVSMQCSSAQTVWRWCFDLLIYGPCPEVFAMRLVLGSVGGLAGFVVGVIIFQHPLQKENVAIWSKIRRQIA